MESSSLSSISLCAVKFDLWVSRVDNTAQIRIELHSLDYFGSIYFDKFSERRDSVANVSVHGKMNVMSIESSIRSWYLGRRKFVVSRDVESVVVIVTRVWTLDTCNGWYVNCCLRFPIVVNIEDNLCVADSLSSSFNLQRWTTKSVFSSRM